MKKANKNKIDNLIDELALRFSKIPNFELTQKDEQGSRLFNFLITKFSEIQDYRSLYQKYFIPSTNKAISDAKKELRTSNYSKVLNISDEVLKENYYETIRLGYVGLFHKFENYTKDLLKEANILFNDGKTKEGSIQDFYKKEFDFKFNDWYSDVRTHKINWISNCVKHYDGYPIKKPKFEYLSHLPEDQKIRIDHKEFYEDVDYIANTFYQFKLSQVFGLSAYKMTKDSIVEEDLSDEMREKVSDFKDKLKDLMI